MSAAQQQEFKVQQLVKFVAYADPGMADSDKLLQPGTLLRIQKINDDQGMVVIPADGKGVGDTVFPEEVEIAAETAAATAEAAAPAKAAKASKKAAAEVKQAPAAKADAKAKAETKPAKPTKAEKAKAKKDAAAAKAKAKADAKATKAAEKAKAKEAKAAAAKTTSTEVVEVRPNITDSESVQKALRGKDALEAAKALVSQVEGTYFTLGGVLHHIYYEGLHKAAGFDGKRGFAIYVEQELGVAYRKAMYLIGTYVKFRRLGVDEKRLAEIGWSKAKEIARIEDDSRLTSDFDSLVAYAKDHSRSELISHLKTTYVIGTTGTERVKKVKLHVAFFADQASTVERAMEAAKNLVGSDDAAQCLEHICGEWSNMTEGVEMDLEAALRSIERRFKVRLSVSDEAGVAQPRPERQADAAETEAVAAE
jgi:hypothetical protein